MQRDSHTSESQGLPEIPVRPEHVGYPDAGHGSSDAMRDLLEELKTDATEGGHFPTFARVIAWWRNP